jgi:glycerol-3-phosphate dehydrogenase
MATQLDPALPFTRAEVIFAARHEMARTVEDVLSRRTRALLLDARAAERSAPIVAELLASELGRDNEWIERETNRFIELAQQFYSVTEKQEIASASVARIDCRRNPSEK